MFCSQSRAYCLCSDGQQVDVDGMAVTGVNSLGLGVFSDSRSVCNLPMVSTGYAN